MKTNKVKQVKSILNKWLIESSDDSYQYEYDQCEYELLQLIDKSLVELLMDRCNSESATVQNISDKVDEIIESWEDEILNSEYECEPSYLLN